MARFVIPLSEAELQRLRDLVVKRIEEAGSDLQPSSFLDNLITKTLRRYPAIQDLEDREVLNRRQQGRLRLGRFPG